VQGQVRWAMAGRTKIKVESVRSELAKDVSPAVADVPIVLADIKDKRSLDEMISATDVLISLVGPYAVHGKEVVKVRTGT
jgi:short subunit dehydrogenase-like uncharacterized protein